MEKEILAEGRGGCLDAIVTAFSLGRFGVLTQKVRVQYYPSEPLSKEDLKNIKPIRQRKTIFHTIGGPLVGIGVQSKIIHTPRI